jgi:GMP synthase (glutamine-hydrolysing)
MINRVVVFQHVPYEALGVLEPLIRRRGFDIETVNLWNTASARPELDGADALIVLGGPMAVYESGRYPHLMTETKIIQHAIERDVPVLGVCLGAQLIAGALGARVYPSGVKEIGWYDVFPSDAAKNDPLLRHLCSTEKLFQWHGDTFDLPHGAVHLASSPLCSQQAFRYGDNVYALQFHLEVDAAMIESWVEAPRNEREVSSLGGDALRRQIASDTALYAARLEQLGRFVFADFIGLLQR